MNLWESSAYIMNGFMFVVAESDRSNLGKGWLKRKRLFETKGKGK
jgi:hypothetical protein